MERIGVVRSVITQNIDDLHNAAGSSKVLEIHGNVRKFRCTACESRYPVEGFDVSEIPPRCPACGGIVKSDTVMFGEPIPTSTLNKCIEEANLCDCMLIVGTSATVYPAAALPIRVKRRGGALIEINPFTSELTDLCDISIRAPSGEILPLLLSELNKRLND
jgi:NAD-dependent deacetylase